MVLVIKMINNFNNTNDQNQSNVFIFRASFFISLLIKLDQKKRNVLYFRAMNSYISRFGAVLSLPFGLMSPVVMFAAAVGGTATSGGDVDVARPGLAYKTLS